MKKIKIAILSMFVCLLGLSINAEAKQYNVEYKYTNIETLSETEKGKLQKLENVTITSDTKVTLVYQKNSSCDIPKQPEEPKVPKQPNVEPKQPVPPVTSTPNTKQVVETADTVSIPMISGLLLGSAILLAVAYKNRKALKVLIVTAVIATGFGYVQSLEAFEKEDKTITVEENTVINFADEKVDCYDLVGVIVETKPTPPPVNTPEQPKAVACTLVTPEKYEIVTTEVVINDYGMNYRPDQVERIVQNAYRAIANTNEILANNENQNLPYFYMGEDSEKLAELQASQKYPKKVYAVKSYEVIGNVQFDFENKATEEVQNVTVHFELTNGDCVDVPVTIRKKFPEVEQVPPNPPVVNLPIKEIPSIPGISGPVSPNPKRSHKEMQ